MKFKIFWVLLLTALIFAPATSFARHAENSNIPEKSGVYDDPDHPGVKVRVFVHHERPTKDESQLLVCSLSDPDSTVAVSSAGWHLPANWTYNLNPSSVPSSVGSSNLSTIVANGFSDWSSAALNNVAFTRGADTTIARSSYDGRNVIAWGRTSGSALGVTYTRYYTSTGLAVDTDTIMNKKFLWKWSNSNTCANSDAYDAENVITHELGHWMGLDDEYDSVTYGNATMFGFASKGEAKKNTLTTSDVTGAQSIY